MSRMFEMLHRRANAGDDVFALGVGQELAVDLFGAGRRVAREGDAGARIVAHVAEDHRHHVDGRAQIVRDLELIAVVDRALAHPRAEHGFDGQLELLLDVGRERLARLASRTSAFSCWVIVAQLVGVQIGVLLERQPRAWPASKTWSSFACDVQHDAPEHLHEATIGIPREALVAGLARQALRPSRRSARGSGRCPSCPASTRGRPSGPTPAADWPRRRGRARTSARFASRPPGSGPTRRLGTAPPALW